MSPAKRFQAAKVTELAELLANKVFRPLDVVLLTRERIQETLEEAAERGRITHSDANDLVTELLRRGRQQTDDLIGEVTRRARRSDPVDRIVRGADRARRTVVAGTSFPILGYDELTVTQVRARLSELDAGELRMVRDYEASHRKRTSLLAAIDRRCTEQLDSGRHPG